MRRALNVITKPATMPKPDRLHWRPDTGRGRLGQQLAAALAAEAAAEVTRLAAAAAASLTGGAGLEAAENVIRAGLIRLGASVLEDLLAADPGYAGPRLDCGRGHRAEIRRLPGQDGGHGARPGQAAPGLVPLRAVRARIGSPG